MGVISQAFMRLNKHLKAGIIIAPFLAVGGYIAAGYYVDNEQKKISQTERYLELAQISSCNIKQGECKLGNGDFRVNLAQKGNTIHLATTHPITNAVISLVKPNGDEKLHKLKQNQDALNWQTEQPMAAVDLVNKLRLLITINKTSYLAEITQN